MKRQLDEDTSHESKRQNDAPKKNREVTTVVVANLPKSYNQGKVRKYFQNCGTILHIDVAESNDKGCRLARVEFSNYNEALSALTRSHKQISNNEILVTLLENCTLWVTNFPPIFNHRDIRSLFKQYGITVLSVRLPSLRFNTNRRFAYVDVISTTEVEKAIVSLNGNEINGYKLVVKRSNPLARSKRSDASVWERREILVRQFDPTKVTEEGLRIFYSKYGSVESIKLSKSEEGKGYAFISFVDHESALGALETNKMQFEGNEIVVSLADRKAYLERQEVKALLNKHNSAKNDRILSLYPLSDKVNKTQIQSLVREKASLNEGDIQKIYLVPDLGGSLIIFNDTKVAAKCSLALNGVQFQNSILHCGSIKDLRKKTEVGKPIYAARSSSPKVNPKSMPAQLSNQDFRKLFFGE